VAPLLARGEPGPARDLSVSLLDRWRRGLRALLRRGAVTREMDDEIAAHLAFATEELVAQGVEPAEAARRARIEFGNVQRVRERAFEERAFAWLDDLARDLGHSWRQLRRTPAATLALVLCGALGIAGVTTVFSFLNGFWLRPLPYEDDGALNSFMTVAPQRWAGTTMPRIVADSVEQRIAPLARSARFNENAARLLLSDSISEIRVAQVDSTVFSILRVAPEAGRAFTAAEYRSGAPVALVAPSIWDQLPSDARRDGSATLLLDGVAHRVVGRMSKSMRFNELSRVWVPLRPAEDRVALLLRRDPGVSEDSVVRALQRDDPRPYTTVAQIAATAPPADTGRWRVRLMPLVDRGHGRPAIYAMVALVLAVAALVAIATASNVAAQLVARARRRQHELATCAALGATAPRLVRRLLADSVLIGGAAGLLGIVAAQLGVRLLVARVDSPGFPGWLTFAVDWRVLAFTVAATLATIALIGVLPAREARRIDPLTALREAGTIGITARGTRRATARLLALQFAVSVVFVSSAAAIVQTYREMTGLAQDVTDTRRFDVFAYSTNSDSSTPIARAALIDSLAATLTADGAHVARHAFVIGVRGTATGDWRAQSGERYQLHALDDSSRGLGSDEFARAPFSAVDTSFFAIDGRRIVAGRGFDQADSASGPVPIIITADLARALWGDSAVIGRAVRISRRGPLATIVGVVTPRRAAFTDNRGFGVWERPEIFLPLSRVEAVNHELVVQTDGDPSAVRGLVRATGKRVAPAFYFGAIRSKAETDARNLKPLQAALVVIGGAALLVMAISLIGLHGIANQSALARRQEIGVRLALGATESQVVRLVLLDTLHAILIGLIAGAGVSVIAIGALDGMFAFDYVGLAASTASAGIAFTAVIVLTCWIPARRVARIAPADVLRSL
jgi:predicted permease